MRGIHFKRLVVMVGFFAGVWFFNFSAGYAAEKLVMGLTTCVTGTVAESGAEIIRGAKTAIAIINESGGLNGEPVNLEILDDQLEKVQSVNNFRSLVQMKNIFVIGTSSTGTSIACNPLAERFKITQVTGSSIGPWKMNEWIFRTTLPDTVTVPFLLKAMKGRLGIKTIGMMWDYKDDWSALCKPIFTNAAKDLGLETPLEPQSYGRGDSDFSAQLSKLKAANVDAIFMPAQVREGSLIVKQARGLGIKSIFCGTSGYISVTGLSAAGEAADGVIAVSVFHPSSKKPGAEKFFRKFRELFPDHKVGSYLDPCWYDAYMLAAEAAKRANIKAPVTEKDRIRVRDEWAKIKGWEGASGIFNYEGPGDPLQREGVLIRFSAKDKDFKLIE